MWESTVLTAVELLNVAGCRMTSSCRLNNDGSESSFTAVFICCKMSRFYAFNRVAFIIQVFWYTLKDR